MSNLEASIAFIALLVAFAAWLASRREAATQAMYTVILKQFVDPSHSDASDIMDPRKGTEPFRNLRAAKNWAKEEQRDRPIAWRDEAQKLKPTESGYTTANRISFHVAENLQNIGAAAMSGAVSLKPLVMVVADVAIDDWLVCKDWIEAYRNSQAVASIGSTAVSYHRRHGEAFVAIALIYADRFWRYPRTDGATTGFLNGPSARLLEIVASDYKVVDRSFLLQAASLCRGWAKWSLYTMAIIRPIGLHFAVWSARNYSYR